MTAIDILWEYHSAFAAGLFVTFQLVGSAVLVGTIIGIGLEWTCQRFGIALSRVTDCAAFVVAAIPALVLLYWLFYPAQKLLGVSISPFWTALVALTIMNSFAVYRIAADAAKDFPAQYIATAKVSGLTAWQTIRYVQGPLLMRAALPRWIDQQVVILQTSVFASLISVQEVFRAAQHINSAVYQPVVIYTAMALLFLVTGGSAMLIASFLRARFHRDFSER